MKRVLIALTLIIATSSFAKAQSIGDLARVERQRQANVTGRVMPEPPAKPVVVPKVEEKTADLKADEKPVEKVTPKNDALSVAAEAELGQLQQEKTVLLTRLSDVIQDRKAVQEIEDRLGQIQKRSAELKLQQ